MNAENSTATATVGAYTVQLRVTPEPVSTPMSITILRADAPIALDQPVEVSVRRSGGEPVGIDPVLALATTELRFRLDTGYPGNCRLGLTFRHDGAAHTVELLIANVTPARTRGWRSRSCCAAPAQ
ncbi:hypothetical protein [Nocardia sp. NPDC058497]|uniref:hypothetical protein n=1 Tax=Nocardia sp. NPDC058497 TaxID=3346529 RepID=UPI0036481357